MTRRALRARDKRRAASSRTGSELDAATRHAREAQKSAGAARAARVTPLKEPSRSLSEQFRPSRPSALRSPAIASFLRLPVHDDPAGIPDVDVLLTGVASDAGSTFRPGARFGPRAVREASVFSTPFSSALGVNVFDEIAAADGGDVSASSRTVEAVIEAVALCARGAAASGVIPGFVGGDRTLTLGALRGLMRSKHRALGLLAISAHPGASAENGQEIHAGNVVRHAVEEGLVRPDCALQLGLRGPYAGPDELSFAFARGIDTAGVDEVRWDLHAVVSQVRSLVQKGAVYVSVDIGALDPAYAPGTSLPVPGGMTTWDLQQILRALVGAEVAGFDVVEIAPDYDPAGITALASVSVLQEILAALADTRRSGRPAPSTHRSGRAGRRSA
ncbi:MAG TPA: arginase family protein [Polyangiaceae bacterium]